jgi:hypothetical protein
VNFLKIAIIALSLVEGGFMAFDGVRALTVGDYLTPSSGPYAGQLGPWAKVVAAAGLAPRSTTVKVLFVAYGVAWLGLTVCFAYGIGWTPWVMLLAAAGTLWYLVPGTVLSALQVLMLAVLIARGGAR